MRGPLAAPSALLILASLLLPARAGAQAPAAEGSPVGDGDARERSRVAFAEGVAALEEGRARDALSHFEQAERLYAHYATAYNIGLCQRALGHPVEAASSFQRYLDGAEGKISAAQFEAVARLIKEAQAKIGTLTAVVQPASATLTIDGAAAKSGQPRRVNPGEHRIEATASGHASMARTVSVPAGGRESVTIALSPAADAPVAASGPRLDAAFWTLAGASLVFLATGAATGAVALTDSAAWEDPATPPDEAEDHRSRGEVLRVVADISFGAALASGVGAALLALLRDPTPAQGSAAAPRVSLRPGGWVGAGVAAVGVGGAF